VQIIRMSPKAGDPSWEVTKVITINGQDVIEPPSPGQKYVITG